MTIEQYEAIMAKLNAIAKAVAPTVITNQLVGTGEPQAAAPTVAEVAANPAKYDGTQWDPINRTARISSQSVIANFESMDKSGEFIGGTFADWAKIDFPGCWRYLRHGYPGLDVNRLSASQRAFLGLQGS